MGGITGRECEDLTGELAAGVNHVDDFNAGGGHSIQDDVIRVGYDFAQTGNPLTDRVEVGVSR